MPRDNIAAFIAEALRNPDLIRTIVEVTDGDTPVAEAVAKVAALVGLRR